MDTKLTLSLDKAIIERAKTYAKSQQLSLSKLIESYLSSLTRNEKKIGEITPLVQSLSGVINPDEQSDVAKNYTDYLIEKYK
ncbi:MAG: hypothetical protein JKY53_03095 [Flavobacteriales bacterium]|nr:hypothetical protein [Flavobacteriales bacterium]